MNPVIQYDFAANLGSFEHNGNVSLFSRNHRDGSYNFKMLDFYCKNEASNLVRKYVTSQLTKNKN